MHKNSFLQIGFCNGNCKVVTRVSNFLRLIATEIKVEATRQRLEVQPHDKDLAKLVGVPANTFSAWLTGRSTNRQFTALMELLDYLPFEKVIEILRFSQRPQPLKEAIQESQKPSKAKRKKAQKKKVAASYRLN